MVLIKKGFAEFFGNGLKLGIFGLEGRWGNLILTDKSLSMRYAWLFIFNSGRFEIPIKSIKSVSISRKMDFRYSWLEISYKEQSYHKIVLLRFPFSGAEKWKKIIDKQLK